MRASIKWLKDYVDINETPEKLADLSVCKIDIATEILTIVTGATNVRQGHIVPVATVGAELPNGMSIKPTKLRGLLSSGMLCSTEELAIDSKLVAPEAKNGIYILPADTAVGLDIRVALGLDDVVLVFELTA
ncbi:MAG: pheT, partial [Firmicutes bacterium]|nr:pheT [Bacillota bacterium]